MQDLYSQEQLRKEAIRRYLSGESPKTISRSLNKSKRWFFKWLERYQKTNPDWFKDQPKTPHLLANKVEEGIENLIVSIRKRLEDTKYAQIGANVIQWELRKFGIEPPPVWTINRILKRNDLISQKKPYEPKGKSYPEVVIPSQINTLHQVDLVGPRFIRGDGRFYSLNVIDVCGHRVKLSSLRSKRDEEIAKALISTWKTLGIPEYIQFDNELSFHGSHKHPHSLGVVLRLCLSLGIQPLFIPQGEPWRNGVVESFNDIYDKGFFRIQVFRDFLHLGEESRAFEEFHNEFHRYSVLEGRTPNEFMNKTNFSPRLLSEEFELPEEPIPLEDGEIHLVRFIRSDRVLDIFGEHFQMPKDVVYEYVVATILTEIHSLEVTCHGERVDLFEYRLPPETSKEEVVKELASHLKDLGILALL